MEKVKVSKDVFDSLKFLEFNYVGEEILDNLMYFTRKYNDGKGWINVKYKALNDLTLREFMACLYYGYELE